MPRESKARKRAKSAAAAKLRNAAAKAAVVSVAAVLEPESQPRSCIDIDPTVMEASDYDFTEESSSESDGGFDYFCTCNYRGRCRECLAQTCELCGQVNRLCLYDECIADECTALTPLSRQTTNSSRTIWRQASVSGHVDSI